MKWFASFILIMLALFCGAVTVVASPKLQWIVAGYDDGSKRTASGTPLLQAAVDPFFPAATQPAPPVPPPAVTPPPSPGTILVPINSSLFAAMNAAKDGSTVLLQRGGRWTGPVDLRWSNFTLSSYGDPSQPSPVILVPEHGAKYANGNEGDPAGVSCTRPLKNITIRGVDVYPPARDPASPPYRRDARGVGLSMLGAIDGLVIEDVSVRLCRWNISIGGTPKDVTLRRVTSTDAYGVVIQGGGPHGEDDGTFAGQGLYVQGITGAFTIDGCRFDHNGWNEKIADAKATKYRHNLYINVPCAVPVLTNCIISRGASCGLQARPGARASTCLFYDNSISVMGIGDTSLAGCAIVGGHRHFDGSGYVGNLAVSSFADQCTLRDVTIIGLPGQNAPDASGKRNDMGAISLSSQYKPHPDWGASDGHPDITASGVRIAGWPGLSTARDGKAFVLPGATITAQPVALPAGWADAVIKGTVDARTAISRLPKP